MTRSNQFEKKLASVLRRWQDKQFDVALRETDDLLKSWPGNAGLHVIWASLVQLQDRDAPSLNEAKAALLHARELDHDSPVAAIELGHFLDNVEDDPREAATAFAEGVSSARRLLIDGLLGQAKALLQLDKREQAIQCLMESLYLTNITESRSKDKSPATALEKALGKKGPFAVKVEALLQELFPKRSA